jgi:hypothetical protein
MSNSFFPRNMGFFLSSDYRVGSHYLRDNGIATEKMQCWPAEQCACAVAIL